MTLLDDLRRRYHTDLFADILGRRSGSSDYSIADGNSQTSRTISQNIVAVIALPTCSNPPSGQSAGKLFTEHTKTFLESMFRHLSHIRPGDWVFSVGQSNQGIAAYDQYAHLSELEQIAQLSPALKAVIGTDYLITPDIVVTRKPVPDNDLNQNLPQPLVGGNLHAGLTPLRAANQVNATLHASISCKWTMRSDRAQNSRTEGLNLIRNRKGKTPHIVVVTFEPMPTRLASIALGTGDIDCTYHAALPELRDAVRLSGFQDQAEMLDTLIEGRRLRDISDLPFNLAI